MRVVSKLTSSFFLFVSIFIFIGNVVLSNAQDNDHTCFLTTRINCQVGASTPCHDFTFNGSKCTYWIRHTFQLCNDGKIPMEFESAGAKVAGDIVALDWTKGDEIPAEDCWSYEIGQKVDICEEGIPWAMMWSRGVAVQENIEQGERCEKYTHEVYPVDNQDDLECPIKVDTTCTVDTTNSDCNKYFAKTHNCKNTPITFNYQICNQDTTNAIEYGYNMKLDGKKLQPFKNKGLTEGKCMTHSQLMTVNSCETAAHRASTGAWLSGERTEHCSKRLGYQYYKLLTNVEAPKCPVKVDTTCTVLSNGSDCGEYMEKSTTCSDVDIKFTYSICNTDPENSIDYGYNMKWNGKGIRPLKQNSLTNNKCVTHEKKLKINSCEKETYRASTGAWVSGKSSNECSKQSGFKYYRLETSEFMGGDMVSHPKCPVVVGTTCTVDNNNSDCNDYFDKTDQCGETPITFSYSICNKDNVNAIEYGYNIKHNGKKLTPFKTKDLPLTGGKCMTYEQKMTINSCERVTHRAYTGAWVSQTRMNECSKQSGFQFYKLLLNVIPPKCVLKVDTKCKVKNNGSDCNDYFSKVKSCGKTPVTFRYRICNKDMQTSIEYGYSIKLNGDKLSPFVGNHLENDSCVTYQQDFFIDSCVNGKYGASTTAWLNSIEDKTCFNRHGFQFYSVAIDRN